MGKNAGLRWLVLAHGLLLTPTVAEGQGAGPVIDLGAGAGLVSARTSVVGLDVSDRESKAGLAVRFNIGAAVSGSFDVYLANQLILHGTARQGSDRAVTGFVGAGATYGVTADVGLKAALGAGYQSLFVEGSLFDTSLGPGLLAGGRYGVSGRWALDLDVLYTAWNDGDLLGSEEVQAWGVTLTLNFLRR